MEGKLTLLQRTFKLEDGKEFVLEYPSNYNDIVDRKLKKLDDEYNEVHKGEMKNIEEHTDNNSIEDDEDITNNNGEFNLYLDEGIYLLKNDHYYSPVELYDIFDKLSNSGYTSISISKSIDSDIYNIARSYQLLHSDKLLDIYICL